MLRIVILLITTELPNFEVKPKDKEGDFVPLFTSKPVKNPGLFKNDKSEEKKYAETKIIPTNLSSSLNNANLFGNNNLFNQTNLDNLNTKHDENVNDNKSQTNLFNLNLQLDKREDHIE